MGRYKIRSESKMRKKARRGFRGYPVATVAFYGSDNTRASKVAVGIVAEENAEPVMARWYSDKTDVRRDPRIGEEILQYFQTNAVKSVVVTEDMLGCPHEEGIHYPEGGICPQCPFWANRDRFSSEIIH